MCIIAAAEKRKLNREEIKNCFASNPNGAGVAWSENGQNHFRKGFMTLEEFQEFYDDLDILPHVAHFRIATSGGVSEQLTHPFIISLNSPLPTKGKGEHPLLFHNGIIVDWKQTFLNWTPNIIQELRRRKKVAQLPSGTWSDTRAAAIMTAYAGEAILNFLGGKYTILDNGIIKTWGEFETIKGVHFSNNGYMPVYSSINSGYWEGGGKWQWNRKKLNGADLNV